MTMPVWHEITRVASIEAGPILRYHPDWLTASGAFPISFRMP